MTETRTVLDILQLAIEREIDARQLYLTLAERVADRHMRSVLKEFADEELEHREKLELEVMKLGKTINLNDRANDTIQPDPDDEGRPLLNIDYIQILLLAIEKENAAFQTYVNLAGTINNPQSRETLLAIAEEEVKHKLRFEIEYDLATKNK